MCVCVCEGRRINHPPCYLLSRYYQPLPLPLTSLAGGRGGSPVSRTHLIGYIIHHYGCLSTSVVHGSQTVVALLTSGVPDLKFDCCVVQTDGLSQEGSCGHNSRALSEAVCRRAKYRWNTNNMCEDSMKRASRNRPCHWISFIRACSRGSKQPTTCSQMTWTTSQHLGVALLRWPCHLQAFTEKRSTVGTLTSDGALLEFMELSLHKTKHKTRLPHSRLS